ncbi:hypothetical protein HK105_205470 [Polyrhizophydium stewartii]|uniref:SigF-like NTF2-like domain-containing protein n=1 Tax=Polyrhizophydium stewartii TaxID=2732419 RepID=A0ABR4N5Y0_9FUNG|nr:hypothetical protein HK105_004011 [Polyrhizophydium stewartii]
MDAASISAEVKAAFVDIVSKDTERQRAAIERIYDPDCRLQNSYLVLQGRDEIVRSYAALASNNVDLVVRVETVTYDAPQQTCMADVQQVMHPKALGGIVSVNMHYIIKLQLEAAEDGLMRITSHLEIPVAQDMLSQMPIVGSWYDNSLRNAVGQISIAGTNLLEYTGLLDLVPVAVQKTRQAAGAVRQRAGQLASSATRAGGYALEATGVPSLVGGVVSVAADYAKWGAASLIEEGRGEHIDCYSPTCRPGKLCYSPTCPRGRSHAWLSRGALQDIVKGAYTGAAKQVGFLKPHPHAAGDRPDVPDPAAVAAAPADAKLKK